MTREFAEILNAHGQCEYKIFDARKYGTDQGAMDALLDEGFVPADIVTIYELIHQGEIPPANIGSGFVTDTMYVSGVLASDYRAETTRMALPRELRNLSRIKGFLLGYQGESLRVFLGAKNFGSTNRFVGVKPESKQAAPDRLDPVITAIDAYLSQKR